MMMMMGWPVPWFIHSFVHQYNEPIYSIRYHWITSTRCVLNIRYPFILNLFSLNSKILPTLMIKSIHTNRHTHIHIYICTYRTLYTYTHIHIHCFRKFIYWASKTLISFVAEYNEIFIRHTIFKRELISSPTIPFVPIKWYLVASCTPLF